MDAEYKGTGSRGQGLIRGLIKGLMERVLSLVYPIPVWTFARIYDLLKFTHHERRNEWAPQSKKPLTGK
jgi:hypothetical protein